MKQKYKIIKNNKNKQIIIQEYSKIDGEISSLLCEEIYDLELIESLAEKKVDIITILRTKNIFPPAFYMHSISNAVLDILNNNNTEPIELNFDDKEIISNETQNQILEDKDIDAVDIDKLLEVNLDKKNNSESKESLDGNDKNIE